MANEESLEHVGVKGMRWGHRRESRLQSLNRVASGQGSKVDKLRTLNNVSVTSIGVGKGLKGAAANKAKELEGRKARILKGEGTVKDLIALHGGDRMVDLSSKYQGQ